MKDNSIINIKTKKNIEVYVCSKCKQHWYWVEKPDRFITAGCIFAPIRGIEICPECKGGKWKNG